MEPRLYQLFFHEWKRNYGSNRVPIWKPLFTFAQKWRHGKLYRNYDLHYVVPYSSEHGSDDVAFYCSKYLLKPVERENRLRFALKSNLSVEDFKATWQIVRSRFFCSKGFGAASDFEKDFISLCIDNSCRDSDGLKYYASDGSTQPLARYYRKFCGVAQAESSFASRPEFKDARSISDLLRSIENGDIIISKVRDHDISPFYPD